MTRGGKIVQIPAQVQLEVKNRAQVMKDLFIGLQETFDSVDPSSALGKGFSKAISQIESKFSKIEGFTGKEFFSEEDFRKVAALIDSIATTMTEMQSRAKGTSAASLGIDISELERARKVISDIRKQIKDDKNKSVGSLLQTDELQNFNKTADKSGFSGGKSYTANISAMEKSVGGLTAEYVNMQTAAEAAKKAAEDALKVKVKANLRNNQAAAAVQKRQQANQQLTQEFLGLGNTRKGVTSADLVQGYKDTIQRLIANVEGEFTENGKDFSEILGSWFEVDPAELQGTATEVVAALQKALTDAAKNKSGATSAAPIRALMQNAQVKFQQGDYSADTGMATLVQEQIGAESDLVSASASYETAKNLSVEADTQLTSTKNLLNEITAQIEKLKQLRKDYEDAVNEFYQDDMRRAQQNVKETEEQIKKPVLDASGEQVKGVNKQSQEIQFLYEENAGVRRAREDAEAEAKQFTDNLKQSVKHWMSAQQIINIVKNGIRTAVNDIKNLDSAMTNIAVVTDMSVSDLWGQINEYMAIAQQYGVTTQGVYEVSQLYYQQGLSAAEVTAATTETLKMARIAGMDYKDAADAMTVAIRAFKMEMSDAEHVTDVYSKVAAVTASDSAELATAMSKTASSAESVGSSFENTTAMLAVMIETTRESAQNLGSALKSIISRYGEMKVGLTVDSEGEEIDYNKVDTALKSVGISIKDAQGQFRDFDEVIFELSEKWDSLDKNTQRYIATIMAGNRQQSRFIALVDNWERLDEVASAAQDSADAGLLQYAKTLDSLDTKLNNIKTSFQQFYMNIFDGEVFKGILDFINKLIQGLNKLGTFQGILNLVNVIKGLKTGLKTIVSLFANSTSSIIGDWKRQSEEWVNTAFNTGYRYGQQLEQGIQAGRSEGNLLNNPIDTSTNSSSFRSTYWASRRENYENMSFLQKRSQGYRTGKVSWKNNSWNASSWGRGISTWGSILSGIASIIGTKLTSNGNHQAGSLVSMGGSALSGAASGAMLGPWGAVIGGVVGALSGLPTVLKEFSHNTKLQRAHEEAKQKAEESNLKRAESKEDYNSLKTLIDKVQSTAEFKNDSEESYQEWIDANNALVEKYPEMLGYIDEYGNSIANLTNSTELLSQKMLQAAEDSNQYYKDKREEIITDIAENSDTEFTFTMTTEKEEYSPDALGSKFFNFLKDKDMAGRNSGYRSADKRGFEQFTDPEYQAVFSAATITPETLVEFFTQGLGIDIAKTIQKMELSGYFDITKKQKSNWVIGGRNKLSNAEDLTEEEFLLMQVLSSSGLVKKQNNNVEINEELQGFLKKTQKLQELDALQSSSIQQALYTASNLTDLDNNIENIKGLTNLLEIYGTTIQNIPISQMAEIYSNPDLYQELISGFMDFYTSIDETKQKIFQNLYEELNSLSLEELQNILTKDLGLLEGDGLYKTFNLQWLKTNYETKSRLVQAYDPVFFKEYKGSFSLNGQEYSEKQIQSLSSYSEWLEFTGKQDSVQLKEEYYNLVSSVIDNSNLSLKDFFLKSTTEVGDAYVEALRSQTKIIDSGGIAGDAAKDRLSKVQEILQEIYSEDFLTKYGLPEDFNIEEYAKLLLADNIGSQEWANALEEFEKKYNLNLADFNEQVFENFGTYLAQTTENMNSAIEDFKNISEVQSKGIDDFEKALKYYEDYAGNLAWDDFYTWTEDGKLIFKNIDQVFSQIGNNVIEVSKQYNQALEAIKNPDPLRLYKGDFYTSEQLISSLNLKEKPTLENLYSDMDRIGIFSKAIYDEVAAWWDWTEEWDEQDIKELEAILAKSDLKTLYNHYKKGLVEIKDLTGSLESFGFTEEQLHDIQTWLATDGKDASYDELLAYLQEQADLLNAQSEYYIQQRKALAKQARQLTFSTAVEGDIKEYNDKQLVGQIIQSGNEFTIEQLQAIGNNLDATYDEVAEIFSLQRDPDKNIWVQKEDLDLEDASRTLISDKVAEATEAYNNAKKAGSGKTKDEIAALELEKERWESIQTYFNGTDSIYAELFESSSKWKEINNSIEAYNKEQIFSDGKIDLNEFTTLSEDTKKLTNLLDNGILTWNDALQSFELSSTLSEEQEAILKDMGIDPNTWVNLVSKQIKSWQEQAEEIISGGGKNLTAKDIEILEKNGYNLEISEGESLSLSQYKTLADANDATAAVYLEQQSKEVSDKLLEIVLNPAETALEDLINLGETIGGEGSVNTEGYIAAINAAEEGNFDAIYGIVEELLQAADGILDISADSINAQKIINKNEVSSSIQDSLSSAYSDLTNVSLSSLTELWKIVYGKTEIDSSTVNSYKNAINAAEQGETRALINILQQLTQTAIQQGYDIDTSPLEAAYKDAANSLIQSLISMLSSAVEGTLSATDMLTLAEKTGLNIEQYATRTVDGWKLSTEGLLAVGAKLEEQYGNVEGVTESIMESLVGEGKGYSGLEDIQEAIANIEAKINSIKDSNSELTKEYDAQLKLLREMENIQFLDPNDPRFNFMDKDSTRGFANGTEEMAATIQGALDALSTLRSGEAIDADSFYNMFDQMYAHRDKNLTDMEWLTSLGFTPEALNELSSAEEKVINSYEDFVTAMMSQYGALNEIDGDVLLEMGLNIEAAAGATQKGLREVADQQIDFLKGIKSVLEAMGALEGLDAFNLELGITSPDGTPITLQNFTEFLDVPGIEEYVQDAITRLQTLLSDLNFGEDFINNLFGSDGFKFTDTKDLEALQGMGNFIALFKKDSAEMWENFATQYPNIVDKSTGNINWAELANVVANMDNLEAFSNGVSAKVEAAVNSSLIAQGFNINLEGSKITLGEGADDQTKGQIKQAIIDEYAKYNTAVEVDFVGNEAVIHVIDPSVSVAMDTLNEKGINWSDYNFEGKFFESEKITFTYEQSEVEFRLRIDKFGKVTAVDANDKEIDSKIVQQYLDDNKISYEATDEEGATFGVQLITPPESEDTVAAIAADVQTIVDLLGAGIKITVEDENTQTVIETILASYKVLEQYILEHPISLDVSNTASIVGTVAQNPEGEGNTNGADLNALKQTIELEWENLEGYKQEDLEQSIDVNYNGLKTYLPTITQKVNLDYSENSTPNVESGTTGATGNVNLMKYGAALAKGTLMGELGPELYVQGGQYRVAGANGPEFVDLQSDAIVFNHLQTAKLLNNGHVSSHGSPVVSEHHAVKAYAAGNIGGIALAGGREDAIAAIDRAIAIWQGIKNASLADMLGSGGGGGSGNSIQAVTAELIEWYNLTRKIAKVEADINQLTAERENIHKRDGAAYLRNLREETKLLQEQHSYNAILRDYKKAQLDRQAREINENQYWSQFMHVDENGLLQYNFGNETDGGKGTLKDLQDFVEMSGEEQQAFLKGIGYSYTTADGEVLEGTELAEMFLEEAQSQIDNYDALYDSWRELGIELENLEQQVAEIEEEIKNNQIELEQDIYDIIVEAWEKEIEAMEEHAELVKEAGEEYVSGLRDAISAEKDMYDRNQATADREQLQRQLALLRRSGGSASEIANLENQLDDMFKDEYFNNQEQMIEDIAKANDEQNKKLEEQIRIQQESLEYQKEHGLIWQQVYDVMSGTTEEILAFMQGRSTEFFTQSLLGQEEMLTEWAHKVGIYTEERAIQSAGSAGLAKYWDNGAVWNNSAMARLQNFYNSMSQEDQDFVRKQFATAYGTAINNGSTEAEAYQAAVEAISGHLEDRQSASMAQEQEASHTTQGTAADYRYVQGGNLHLRANASTSSTSYGTYGTGTKVKVLSDEGEWCKVEVNGKTGYMMSKYLAKSGSGSGSSSETGSDSGTGASSYRAYYNVVDSTGNTLYSGYGAGSSESQARNNAYYKGQQWMTANNKTGTVKITKVSAYAQGGLVDYTGIAMVHGKPSKPEAFLNASQTKLISDSLKIAGDGGALDHLRSTIEKIRALAQGFQTIKYNNPSISIAPGAITIQVAELADSYDIEDISRDIMDRINTIAAKATSRSINRR